MIKAVIFDFDGLIFDTETPEYQSWAEVYSSFGDQMSFTNLLQALMSL